MNDVCANPLGDVRHAEGALLPFNTFWKSCMCKDGYLSKKRALHSLHAQGQTVPAQECFLLTSRASLSSIASTQRNTGQFFGKHDPMCEGCVSHTSLADTCYIVVFRSRIPDRMDLTLVPLRSNHFHKLPESVEHRHKSSEDFSKDPASPAHTWTR